MEFSPTKIRKYKSLLGSLSLPTRAALGMTLVLVVVSSTKINGIETKSSSTLQSCSQSRGFQTKKEFGKTCTSCQRWRPSSEYHRNKSKSDQLESHCKSCVSRRKELRRQSLQWLERRCEAFTSVIVGGLNPDAIERFAGVFGAAAKEVLDDSKEKAH